MVNSDYNVLKDWMFGKLNFLLEDLDPSNSVNNALKLLSNIRTNEKLDSMISGLADGKNLLDDVKKSLGI